MNKKRNINNEFLQKVFNELSDDEKRDINKYYYLLINPEFIERLKSNPHKALSEEGYNISDEIEIELVKADQIKNIDLKSTCLQIPIDLYEKQKTTSIQTLEDDKLKHVVGGTFEPRKMSFSLWVFAYKFVANKKFRNAFLKEFFKPEERDPYNKKQNEQR